MSPDIVLMLFVAGLAAGLWHAHRSHMAFVDRAEKAQADLRLQLEEEMAYREYADQQYSALHRRLIDLHQGHEALQKLYATRTVELLQLSMPVYQRVVAYRKQAPGK